MLATASNWEGLCDINLSRKSLLVLLYSPIISAIGNVVDFMVGTSQFGGVDVVSCGSEHEFGVMRAMLCHGLQPLVVGRMAVGVGEKNPFVSCRFHSYGECQFASADVVA